MDIITSFLFIAGIFNIFLATVIFAYGPKNKNDVSYAVLVGTLVLWIATIIGLRRATLASGAYFVLAVSHFSGIAIAVSFWYFVMFFTGTPIRRLQISLILGGGLAVTLLAFLSRNFTLEIQNLALPDKHLTMGPLHFFFLAYFSLVMFDAFYRLSAAAKRTQDHERRTQFRLVFWGTLITTLIGGTFNIILLRFGNSGFISYGPLATIIMVIFITYAIMKHNLMSIRVISAEFFTMALVLVLLGRLVFSQNMTEFTINGASVLLAIGFGILLIRSVMREVRDREKIEQLAGQLESTNQRLVKLDKIKSEFLSFASHQVKAPMTIIKGFATLMADGSYGSISEKAKDVAGRIKDSSDRMIALVDNILNLRRIEEGRMEYVFADINLAELVKDIVQEFQPLARNKNLALTAQFADPNAIVHADMQKLRQVIQNLIDNAIKYTDGGTVAVSVKEGLDDSFLITVTDSGRGITKEMLPKLFEQFSRDVSSSSKVDGTGLGLYIAKEIIHAHSGKIWAESDGPGAGSVFTVQLPRAVKRSG